LRKRLGIASDNDYNCLGKSPRIMTCLWPEKILPLWRPATQGLVRIREPPWPAHMDLQMVPAVEAGPRCQTLSQAAENDPSQDLCLGPWISNQVECKTSDLLLTYPIVICHTIFPRLSPSSPRVSNYFQHLPTISKKTQTPTNSHYLHSVGYISPSLYATSLVISPSASESNSLWVSSVGSVWKSRAERMVYAVKMVPSSEKRGAYWVEIVLDWG